MSEKQTSLLRYIVPNLVTSIGLIIALFSIMYSVAGEFETAAWLILLCVLIDQLDGTTARLLNASSRFGVELDSFSDFISFGLAPGFLVLGLMTKDPRYIPYFQGDTMVWLVRSCVVFFVLMSALRLAKFNVTTEKIGSRLFLGIPTTLTGAIFASFVLTAWKYEFPPETVATLPYALLFFGLWMVSNIRLPKFKKTASTPYNIFMITNAMGAYLCVPFQVMPEYLLFLAGSYAIVGSIVANFFMDWRPEEEAPVAD
jgi:CDP-diacylglycerol--serine O-phosphatidyltransferase